MRPTSEGLPATPYITKFFTNKIESSKSEWGDYLLEVADLFVRFDGELLDRESLTECFSQISGRSPYALRDISNFRDEFGAYGTYLGLFHIQKEHDGWKIHLSQSAKRFLCGLEPDVEAFCRSQLALFQYPNGAGLVPGSSLVQSNVLCDTVREISNHVRINPLRLTCRLVVLLHENYGIPLDSVEIDFSTIFMLFNDSRINRTYSPKFEVLQLVLEDYVSSDPPDWAKEGRFLTKFKRNFHILERTGLFERNRSNSLKVSTHPMAFSYIKCLSQMDYNFCDFEKCYGLSDPSPLCKDVILSSAWGKYYDSLNLPTEQLAMLVGPNDSLFSFYECEPLKKLLDQVDQPFPALKEFHSNEIKAYSLSNKYSDPFLTLASHEKANREHARILALIASNLRAMGHKPFENTFIDLFVEVGHEGYIFEVKSSNQNNYLSQIRKAISQLYEYRYRSGKLHAHLCLVLQHKPSHNWVLDYLLSDREILVCWLVDNLRLECPPECYQELSRIGVIV